MSYQADGTKWCHLSLATYRNRRLFKIAAAARFCERQARAACAAQGWTAEAVRVKPDMVQLLVEVPAGVGKQVLVSRVKHALTDALRQGHLLPPWSRRAFGEGYWCSVVTNAAGLQALRRHLSQ